VLSSRPAAEVLDEIGRLIDSGYREIVLTGIHLGHYGIDLIGEHGRPRHDLADLVRRILECAPGGCEFRVRISSIEAVEVTPTLLEVMAGCPDRVCPHVHVSMQSGSDAVLARMRRRWASERFADRCREIRERLDQPALTTDVIVGFPGETDADFEATCRAVEEIGFSKLHVFRFSPRPGTEAADMPDQVPATVKRRRAAELDRIGRRLRQRFLRSLIGRDLQVLLESRDDRPGMLLGTSSRYVTVAVPIDAGAIGQLVQVRAQGLEDGRILGATLESTR
jgi:threonylcarbamoyladenosine tRNA methylthiotransferase MtaB